MHCSASRKAGRTVRREVRMSRRLAVGGVPVGGGSPVAIQSMTTTFTSDTEKTLGQIFRLAEAGCDIVRVSVRDEGDARAIRALKERSPLPVVADIHFSARLAVLATKAAPIKCASTPATSAAKNR